MDAQVKRRLQERAAEQPPAHDWCYVNNFGNESKPRHLRLPAGRGRRLAHDLEAFAGDLQGGLAAATGRASWRGCSASSPTASWGSTSKPSAPCWTTRSWTSWHT